MFINGNTMDMRPKLILKGTMKTVEKHYFNFIFNLYRGSLMAR